MASRQRRRQTQNSNNHLQDIIDVLNKINDKIDNIAQPKNEPDNEENDEKRKIDNAKNNVAVFKKINELVKVFYQTAFEIKLKELETFTKIATELIKTQGKTISNAVSSSLKSYSGVREGAYAAANASIDSSMNIQKYEMGVEELRLQMENFSKIKTGEFAGKMAESVGLAVGSAFGPVGAVVGSFLGSIVSDWANILIKNNAQLSEKELKMVQDVDKAILDEVKSTTSTIRDFANQIETNLEKHEKAAVTALQSLGSNMNNKSDYMDNMFKMQEKLGFTTSEGKFIHYDKDMEDMTKWQTDYIEQTGRNIAFGQQSMNDVAGLGKLMGDDKLAVDMVSKMEIFNHSVSDSKDMFYEMYQTANKMGISNRKFSKELIQNLKIAEKYQFKAGVKGMMEMALWAQKVGLSMQSFSNTIEGIQTGGLEDNITKAAKLQVLGGGFAMGSDPLAMIYEGFNDPEALAKRMTSMIDGIGVFDKTTGEARFNQADQMRLRQYAEVTGQDYTDVLNQRRRAIKGGEVEKQFGINGYTEEEKSLIIQKAQLNRETGRYEVDLGNGQAPVDVANLNENDILQLMPVEEKMEDHLAKILAKMDEMKGVTIEGNSIQERRLQTKWGEEVKKRIDDNKNFFGDEDNELTTMIEGEMKFVTEQNALQHKLMTSVSEALTDYHSILTKGTKDLITKMTDMNDHFNKRLKLLAEGGTNFNKIKLDEYESKTKEDKEQSRLDIREANKKYKENIDGNIWSWDEKWDKTVAVNALETGSDSGWDWVMNRLKSVVQGFSNTNEELDDRYKNVMENTEYVEAYDDAKSDNTIRDGVASSNGTPMAVAANKVVPVQDGTATIAKSDPKDSAIFAKTGGPFDTLFNGIFGKINETHEQVSSIKHNKSNNGMVPKSYNPFEDNVIIDRGGHISYSSNGNSVGYNNNSGTLKIEPIKLEMSGRLELSSNGQTIDIMKEIENNPLLLRQLTQMISETLSSKIQGGKSVFNGNDITYFK